jgi:hypothetical protein
MTAKHRTAPVNREPMKPGQDVKDVLIKNRNLEDLIESFRNTHLQQPSI